MADSSKLHLATLVSNIKTFDPSAKKSEPTTAEVSFLKSLDSLVRKWIYGTISNDLLNTIIDPDERVVDTWNRLENFFNNNKSTCALHLDAQFKNTKLDQFDGVKPYYTRLKTLVDNLRNVGDKVSDNRMALQLLKRLSEEYKPFCTSVRHLNPLPTFDILRSMLELEEQGNASDIPDSGEEAHFSQSSSSALFNL
ncbi:uncharacterized protein LOC110713604 [Chenopodium quinoa]|uniref:uncharacterized protein LOC110713604 n=1 Tax=Chenopodium quinoa TaxID=63459 RepID=UPI000B77895E|nr:uncharacterized protein LOC110713604 [Chenopodium quinoa]